MIFKDAQMFIYIYVYMYTSLKMFILILKHYVKKYNLHKMN